MMLSKPHHRQHLDSFRIPAASSALSILALAATVLLPKPLGAVSPAPRAAQQAPAASGSSGPLLQQLRAQDPKERKKAAQEIAKNGKASDIPALTAALHDPSPGVRRQVVLALASFRSPLALDGLIEAARDTDQETRSYAVEGIIGYYTGQTPGSGFVAFLEKQYRRAKQSFVPDNTRIDPGTPVDPRAVSALQAVMMDTRSGSAAREATRGLGILGARSAVPGLVRTAHSPDQDLALEALNSLMKIKDTAAGPQLVNLLDSSDRSVQCNAAVTVGFLRARQALPKLQSLYANAPDPETREKALQGLAYLGQPASVPIFLKAIWNPGKKIRMYGAEGLGRAGDQAAVQDLLKASVVEKDSGVRMAMEFGLISLGNNDYLSELVNNLGSRLRGDTAQAYLTELAANRGFLPKLYPFLNSRDSGVRSRICAVLMVAGDNSSIEPLEKASHDQNADVAAQAIRALRAVRVRLSRPANGNGR